MRSVRQIISAYSERTSAAPAKPKRSPITAKMKSVVGSDTSPSVVCDDGGAAAELLPGADRDRRLVLLPAARLGVRRRVQERRDPRRPRCAARAPRAPAARRSPRRTRRCRARRARPGAARPRRRCRGSRPRPRCRRGSSRGPARRSRASPARAPSSITRATSSRPERLARAVDDERGEEHDQQHLAELRRLEGERADRDRARRGRAGDRVADGGDDHDRARSGSRRGPT